ncbi:MAG: hypothetical protein HWE16_14055 [Gammaproteobacteria bacterium]|nr:hypothetical protein [Gammaproteobacteria bacterium]
MAYNTEIDGNLIEVNNKIGMALIEQFQDRFSDDEFHLHSKVNDIKDRDLASCFLYWFNLDPEGQQLFAKNLKVTPEKLRVTCENIREIFNN